MLLAAWWRGHSTVDSEDSSLRRAVVSLFHDTCGDQIGDAEVVDGLGAFAPSPSATLEILSARASSNADFICSVGRVGDLPLRDGGGRKEVDRTVRTLSEITNGWGAQEKGSLVGQLGECSVDNMRELAAVFRAVTAPDSVADQLVCLRSVLRHPGAMDVEGDVSELLRGCKLHRAAEARELVEEAQRRRDAARNGVDDDDESLQDFIVDDGEHEDGVGGAGKGGEAGGSDDSGVGSAARPVAGRPRRRIVDSDSSDGGDSEASTSEEEGSSGSSSDSASSSSSSSSQSSASERPATPSRPSTAAAKPPTRDTTRGRASFFRGCAAAASTAWASPRG